MFKKNPPPIFYNELTNSLDREVEIRAVLHPSDIDIPLSKMFLRGTLKQIDSTIYKLSMENRKKATGYGAELFFDRNEVINFIDSDVPIFEISYDKYIVIKDETVCPNSNTFAPRVAFKYLFSKINKNLIVNFNPVVDRNYIYGKLKYDNDEDRFYIKSQDLQIFISFSAEAVCKLQKGALPKILVVV